MVKRLEVMTLSGREFKVEDFALIKETISLYPQLSRKELSKTICELLLDVQGFMEEFDISSADE